MGTGAVQEREIYDWVASQLTQMFEIDAARIRPDAQLFQDLDIDSIDAVDLIVRLKPLVGKRMNPEAFKTVRTVQDVADALARLVNDPAPI